MGAANVCNSVKTVTISAALFAAPNEMHQPRTEQRAILLRQDGAKLRCCWALLAAAMLAWTISVERVSVVVIIGSCAKFGDAKCMCLFVAYDAGDFIPKLDVFSTCERAHCTGAVCELP